MPAPLRNAIRKHLSGVLEQTSRQGVLKDTPWQQAVWLHQAQATSPVFSNGFPFFSTTWKVYTGWRRGHGYKTHLWVRGPEDAVEIASKLRSEGWDDVFICSSRFGLTGTAHRVVANLENPVDFSRLTLVLEREQNEKLAESLTANVFSSLAHFVYGTSAGIVRGLIKVTRFAKSRENPSWYEFWAILAWRFAGSNEKSK